MAESRSKQDGSKFKVEGQSLCSASVCGPDRDSASDCPTSGYVSKVPSSDGQDSGGTSDVTIESGESGADDIMCHVMAVNTNLVQQIDALRLRLEIDFKHNQEQRSACLTEAESKLQTRETELSNLKVKVTERTDKLTKLTKDNAEKSQEVEELQRQIDELRNAVGNTKHYADELESEMSILKLYNGKLQTGTAYQEKEEEIRELHREIGSLRKNLLRMEKELTRAKELICQQGGRIRFMEGENKNFLSKFKGELNKISLNMRQEVGKMRDVMQGQWQEMKDLREQNETMGRDIRDIRALLLEQNQSKRKMATTAKSSPGALPVREPSHMISMAFKPAFPVKSKDRGHTQLKRP